jgi:hypothetical protein
MDTRKMLMKEAVRVSLLQSRNYEEFRLKMESKGYELIRGRGIAFRDEKKLYVKGSDLGYSLSNIQKILQLSLVQKQAVIRQDIRKEKQHHKLPPSNVQKDATLNKLEHFSKALEILLRPEREYNLTPFELLQKKRKKQSHHL